MLATHMVRVGKQTGPLKEMLLKAREIFEADTCHRLTRLVAPVERLIVLAMGLVVGLIVLATSLAIFSIDDTLISVLYARVLRWSEG